MHLHTRFYRLCRGIPLTHFARMIGVSPGQLSEKERWLESYTLPQIGLTALLLGVPIQYLLEIPGLEDTDMDGIPVPPRDRLITIPLVAGKGG